MLPEPAQVWPPLTGPLLPAEGEVLLACAPLDLPAARVAALRDTLEPAERERADRFVTEELRSRWTAARGHLRALLAAATGAPPGALRFRTGPQGKPSLLPESAPLPAGPPLTFNLSHSRGLGLYALGRGVALGVDVEAIQARRHDELADRFFHPDEAAWLRTVPEPERPAAFFAVWSAKEALIKATGEGLSQGLASFCFACDARGPVRLRWLRGEPGAEGRWTLHRLALAPGFAAALVTGAPGLRLRAGSWG